MRQRETSEIAEAMEYLQKNGKADSLMLVAQMFTNMGQWDNAQEIAIDMIYRAPELLKEYLMIFISFYMSNTDKEKDEVTLEQVGDNTVVFMSKVNVDGNPIIDDLGQINRIIAIHRKKDRVNESGENKFGCENYTSQDNTGLILIATGYKGEIVTLREGTFVINEIVRLYTYILQKCWEMLEEKYPNHNFYQKVVTDNIEDMVDEMKEIMGQQDQYRKKQLDMYNFINNPMGMPVSFLGGKEPTKYVQTLMGLLYYDKQPVYSGEISYHKDANYVVSVSSIVLLTELGMLGKLKDLNNRVCITSATKSFIELGLTLSKIETVSQAGTLYLTEDNNLSMVELTDNNKKDWKAYWSNLLLATMDMEVIDVEVEFNDKYDGSAKLILDADIQTIEAVRIQNRVLLSDDLFIRRLARMVDKSIQSTNIVGFLLSTEKLKIEEALNVHHKLSSFKYIYSIDKDMLLELYLLVIEKDDDVQWDKFGELIGNLLEDKVIQYYYQEIKEFLMKVLLKGILKKRLYDLMWEKMEMRPYDELFGLFEKKDEVEEQSGEN